MVDMVNGGRRIYLSYLYINTYIFSIKNRENDKLTIDTLLGFQNVISNVCDTV